MPEALVPGDLEQFSGGRLSQTDPEVVRALNAALSRARDYCHWHVSPVIEDTATVQGEGWPDVTLPTKAIAEVSSITENGVPVDLNTVVAEGSTVTKKSGCWYGTVVVEYTHGYAAAECESWREAVLQMAVTSLAKVEQGGVVSQRVDDVEVKWATGGDPEIAATLDRYRRKWWAV